VNPKEKVVEGETVVFKGSKATPLLDGEGNIVKVRVVLGPERIREPIIQCNTYSGVTWPQMEMKRKL